MFKPNEGIVDRIVRITLGLLMLPTGLFLLGGLQGNVLGLIVTGLSAGPLITGATGFCPLYTLFGFSTLDIERRLIERCRSMMVGRDAGRCLEAGSSCCPRPRAVDEAAQQEA